MVDIQIIGGGSASVHLDREVHYPNADFPKRDGWETTQTLTATPADGWTFDHWEETYVTVTWYAGERYEERHTEEVPLNPHIIGEADFIAHDWQGPGQDADFKTQYLEIKAVFKCARLDLCLTVEPEEAKSAGCEAVFNDTQSAELSKHGDPGDTVTVGMTATIASGWRLYGWKRQNGAVQFVHNRTPYLTRQLPLDYVDDREEIVALFKVADGMPLCKRTEPGKKKFVIGCSPTSGEILCNE